MHPAITLRDTCGHQLCCNAATAVIKFRGEILACMHDSYALRSDPPRVDDPYVAVLKPRRLQRTSLPVPVGHHAMHRSPSDSAHAKSTQRRHPAVPVERCLCLSTMMNVPAMLNCWNQCTFDTSEFVPCSSTRHKFILPLLGLWKRVPLP